jgi:actin-related protein 3
LGLFIRQNIVLSGGSTLYRNFSKRLEEEIQERVNTRLKENMDRISKKTGVVGTPTELPVKVIQHKHQRYAVWLGGSFVAGSVRDQFVCDAPLAFGVHNPCFSTAQPGFETLCHSRAKYLEEGPRIARHNAVFSV